MYKLISISALLNPINVLINRRDIFANASCHQTRFPKKTLHLILFSNAQIHHPSIHPWVRIYNTINILKYYLLYKPYKSRVTAIYRIPIDIINLLVINNNNNNNDDVAPLNWVEEVGGMFLLQSASWDDDGHAPKVVDAREQLKRCHRKEKKNSTKKSEGKKSNKKNPPNETYLLNHYGKCCYQWRSKVYSSLQ